VQVPQRQLALQAGVTRALLLRRLTQQLAMHPLHMVLLPLLALLALLAMQELLLLLRVLLLLQLRQGCARQLETPPDCPA
jgi:hypothetical protein